MDELNIDYISVCRKHLFTKSFRHFARNTLDCLKYIRQLKDRNIPVFFEKENINTMDSKADLPVILGRGEPRTDWKKPGGRWHTDSGGKGKMADIDIAENIAE